MMPNSQRRWESYVNLEKLNLKGFEQVHVTELFRQLVDNLLLRLDCSLS